MNLRISACTDSAVNPAVSQVYTQSCAPLYWWCSILHTDSLIILCHAQVGHNLLWISFWFEKKKHHTTAYCLVLLWIPVFICNCVQLNMKIWQVISNTGMPDIFIKACACAGGWVVTTRYSSAHIHVQLGFWNPTPREGLPCVGVFHSMWEGRLLAP